MEKIALNEEIVKYIFPGTEPAIAMGEDGCVVYDFKKSYPDKLGIFIPNEVDRSNYSNVFPRPFEGYFLNMDEEVSYISRFLEVVDGISPLVRYTDAEFIPGKVLKGEKDHYTVFRFDELVDPGEKTDLLCRLSLNYLGAENEISILDANPCFTGDVTGLNGTRYYYWIMPFSQLFSPTDEFYAALFAYTDAFRQK